MEDRLKCVKYRQPEPNTCTCQTNLSEMLKAGYIVDL